MHLGPAMFIGMNNFSFLMDDQVLVTGSFVSHGGDMALWAREVHKRAKTLTLRGPDGRPGGRPRPQGRSRRLRLVARARPLL